MSFLAAKKIRQREEHRLGTKSTMEEKMKRVKEVLDMEEEEQRERGERKGDGKRGAMRVTLQGGGINMRESKELDRIIEAELNWSIANQEELERLSRLTPLDEDMFMSDPTAKTFLWKHRYHCASE